MSRRPGRGFGLNVSPPLGAGVWGWVGSANAAKPRMYGRKRKNAGNALTMSRESALFPVFFLTLSRSLPKRFYYDEFFLQSRRPARCSGGGGKLQRHETDQTPALPRNRARRRGGQLFRYRGSRSLPVARRRQFRSDGRLGRRRERRDPGLSLADSVPRGDPRAADRVVELSQGGGSREARRLVVLYL